MRNLSAPDIERLRERSARVLQLYGDFGDDMAGVFNCPSPIDSVNMCVIACDGEGWEHVSVSRTNRCPNWIEMEHVKRLFFLPTEVCMQLHVAESDHLSYHPYCLHIWRPNDGREIPLPPSFMVAPAPRAPYPFCVTPDRCAGLGSCPRDPCCAD